MKIIIAGTRYFNNYELLKSKVNNLIAINKYSDIEIVSGHATGADSLGERFAKEYGYALKLFPADWDVNGKAAGPIRNKQMGNYADVLIAFWDGNSRGTFNMIHYMESLGKPFFIVNY